MGFRPGLRPGSAAETQHDPFHRNRRRRHDHRNDEKRFLRHVARRQRHRLGPWEERTSSISARPSPPTITSTAAPRDTIITSSKGTVELNGDYSAGRGVRRADDGQYRHAAARRRAQLQSDDQPDDGVLQLPVSRSTRARSARGDTLIFDGSADTSGQLKVVSRAGHVDLTSATFFTIFDLGSTLNAGDKITGHSGASQTEVDLSGDYSAGMVLDSNLMTNVTSIASEQRNLQLHDRGRSRGGGVAYFRFSTSAAPRSISTARPRRMDTSISKA